MSAEEQIAYHEALRRIKACRARLRDPDEANAPLDLISLGLNRLPPEISQLSTLTRLYLFGNQLSVLPPEIGQLSALKRLDLSNNQLSGLPPEIGHLSALTRLSIARNQLSTLPPEIGRLSSLTRLILSDNLLRALPFEVCQLAALKRLSLNGNQLRELPLEIGRMENLEEVTLERNELRELPSSMRSLRRLKELTLHGNHLLALPVEVLGPVWRKSGIDNPRTNPREILDYYFASRGDAGQALREIKVLVVGRPGAGKTSIIRRLGGELHNSNEPETHGIAIQPLPLPCADGPVTARVWDFGGQHVLHAMHEFFFTGRSLYLLVLSEREDLAERDAEYWLQLIRSYTSDAPVIVALNKTGKRSRELDLPRRKLHDRYGPVLGWLPTECTEPDEEKAGIAELRQTLARIVSRMPEIQARFPRKWLRIKEWLAEMKDNYLEYSIYAERCSSLGESDPAKQEELAAFLHDLGVALNFRRDPRLHETTVLRPDWLVDGIYALLRANDTRHPRPLAPDGRITLQEIPSIYAAAQELGMLRAADYPIERHPFLLRLMAAFQLSFPLDEEGKEQLVPALLSVEEPPDPPWPLGRATVELRWEFPVIPAPLFPRLLVRTFGLVVKLHRWRRGAYYGYGRARAKVWEDKERYLYISAGPANDDGGDPEVTDDLVRMIRATLRGVVAEYRSLAAQEQVRWKKEWLPRNIAEDLGLCPAEEQPPTTEELP